MYYVLSEIDQYHSFAEVINIRAGGLAIYGGIIAGGITVLAVCYFKKINFLAFADYVAPAVLLAQGIGRWGNFMNGEAFGYQSDWFCRMGLSNVLTGYQYMEVHPTFLYESLWNLLGVALVFLFDRYLHKKYDGQLFFMIFAWYGFGRTFIEGLRTDSLYFNFFGTELRTSQILGAALCIIFTGLLVYFAIKKPNKPFYCKTQKETSSASNKKVNCGEKNKAEVKKNVNNTESKNKKVQNNKLEKNNAKNKTDFPNEEVSENKEQVDSENTDANIEKEEEK